MEGSRQEVLGGPQPLESNWGDSMHTKKFFGQLLVCIVVVLFTPVYEVRLAFYERSFSDALLQ